MNRRIHIVALLLLLLVSALRTVGQDSVLVDSLLHELEVTESDQDRVDLLNLLSFTHWYNDPALSRDYAQQALDVAKRINYFNGLYDAQASLANYNLVVGNYREADNLYRKNLDRALREADTLAIGIGHMNLGVALDYNHRPAEALDQYFRSIDILSIDSLTEFGTIFMNIGNIYMIQGKFPLATEYYEKARVEAEQNGDDELLSFVHNSLADNFLRAGQTERAFPHIELALSKAVISNTRNMESSAFTLFGMYFSRKDDLKLGETYFEKAEVLEKEINAAENRMLNFHEWGKLCMKSNRYKKAQELFEQQLGLAEKSRDLQGLSLASQNMADLYSQTGDYRKAFEYERKSRLYNDSLEKRQNLFDIGRLESRQLIAKTTFENEVLRQEQILKDKELEMQESEITKQRFWLTGGILSVLLMLGIIIALQRAYRSKELIAKQMREKNEEIALQQEQIMEQKENLSQLNEIKDQIFSMVSHDLRAPLLNIKSSIELWNSGMLTSEETEDLFSSLYEETSRNLNLLDNLLYWAKSQLEGFHAQKENLDLRTLIQGNIDLFQQQIANKSLKIETNLNGRAIRGYGDRDMIDLVVRNLLHNAIKFTPENGTITFRAEEVDTSARLIVQDTGVGIATEAIDAIKNPMRRVSNPGTQNEKGSGLGLSICMDFIQRNSGKFFIDSQEGEGTRAGFQIPKEGP